VPLLGVTPLPPSLRGHCAAETGLPEHPDAGAIYAAWMGLFPYDSVEKILAILDGAELPGTDPTATVSRAPGWRCRNRAHARIRRLSAYPARRNRTPAQI